MNVMENPLVADLLDEVIANSDGDFDLVLARIPSLFGISDKATYLAFRSLGLNTIQALGVMGLPEEYIDYWKNTDPNFLEWELRNLRALQSTLSIDITKLNFLRNMALFTAKDASIIRRSITDLNGLSKLEFDYLMKVRTHYTPADLLALEKALEPEKHRENVVISLSWDNISVVEGVEVPYHIIEETNGNNSTGPKRIQLSDPQEAN